MDCMNVGVVAESDIDEACDEILKVFPAHSAPIETSVHHNTENDEAVLKLHPSPTPTLDDPVTTSNDSGKVKSLIRVPREEKTAKKRGVPFEVKPTETGTGSKKGNSKRSSDNEVFKVKKKVKEINTTWDERTESDETVLKLHPSPTPALDDSVTTSNDSGKIKSLIRIPREEKIAKKRGVPYKEKATESSSGSKKENAKRPSDDEYDKVNKRAKESGPSLVSTDKTKSNDRDHFKIPLKPTVGIGSRPSNYQYRPSAYSSCYSRPSYRGGSYGRYDNRGPYLPRNTGWSYQERGYDRPSASSHRMINLSEQEIRWIEEMRFSWRR